MDSNIRTAEIQHFLQNNNAAAAAEKILDYLEEQNNIQLDIAITGESGSGKSTFVNAFRGIEEETKGAAPTGCVETTMEKAPYPHPNYPNVTLWDLPGIGTTKFPAQEYLQHVGFERFDFFIIISADRFRENDVKLAKEIQKMGKKFYFVRSKIDNNMRDEKRKKKTKFNEKETYDEIKKNCIKGLKEQGIKSPQVFLVSSVKLGKYDFCELEETLERELPAHKRNALLFAMPNINLEIIKKKKKALKSQIKYYVGASALGAAVPIPGLSLCVDLAMLIKVVTKYTVAFGLNKSSLQKLSESTGVPLSDLTAVIKSPLVTKKITVQVMIDALTKLSTITAFAVVEEGFTMIPLFGTTIAMTISSITTYKYLNYFLDTLAEDAQNVFKKALGLETSV